MEYSEQRRWEQRIRDHERQLRDAKTERRTVRLLLGAWCTLWAGFVALGIIINPGFVAAAVLIFIAGIMTAVFNGERIQHVTRGVRHAQDALEDVRDDYTYAMMED